MIDLAHHFTAIAAAEKLHDQILRAISDQETMSNESRDAEPPAAALAGSVHDVFNQFNSVYHENTALREIAQGLLDKGLHKGYAMLFFNANDRLSTSVALVGTRLRATLSNASRVMLNRELETARDVIKSIEAAQSALRSAHAVYESMAQDDRGTSLAIAFQ
ncbi:hypothetical protein GCM10028794_27960 [Silanimonas algicola]